MPTNKCRRNYRRKKSPFHNLIVIIDGGKKSVDAKTSGQKFNKEQNIDIIPKFISISHLFKGKNSDFDVENWADTT